MIWVLLLHNKESSSGTLMLRISLQKFIFPFFIQDYSWYTPGLPNVTDDKYNVFIYIVQHNYIISVMG